VRHAIGVEGDNKKQSGRLSILAGLLVTSLAGIALLTVAIAGSARAAMAALEVRDLVILAILDGAFAFFAIVVTGLFRAVRAARRSARREAQNAASLQKELQTAEAIISAQAMTVISFEQGPGEQGAGPK